MGPHEAFRIRKPRNMRELRRRLRRGADMQFFVNTPDISVRRRHADVKRIGNFPAKTAAGEQFQAVVRKWQAF